MVRIYLLAIMLFVAATSAAPCTKGPKYRITELETPAGGILTSASAINNAGTVAGDVDGRAVIWRKGRCIALDISRGESNVATAINDKDVVVVEVTGFNGESSRALVWKNGRTEDIGTLGGKWTEVSGINNKGQVVGASTCSDDTGCMIIWDARKGLRVFEPLSGQTYGDICGINNKGQLVGQSAANKAFIWQNGKMNTLPPVPGWETSRARAINDKGVAVGESENVHESADVKAGLRACLWDRNGKVVDLGALGGASSQAFALNNKGQVVGMSGMVAFIWQDGKITDLNKLIPPDFGWRLITAHGINDAGQIAADGQRDGYDRAFLLTPIK